MAKNSQIGLVYVYDLAHNVIRKFDVYTDSTCGNQPVLQTNSGEGQQTQDAGGGGVDCGSFKAAEELTPVDATVQSTFDALHRVYVGNPTIATQGSATRVGTLPIDPTTGKPFDAQNVAWEYPQGSYMRFMQAIEDQLSTKAGANAFIPYLGDDMYDWTVASFDIGALWGVDPGLTFTLHWDRASSVRLYLYADAQNDVVLLTVSLGTTGVPNVAYQGVIDFNQNLYPSQNGVTPGNLTAWHFRNGGGGHFGNELRQGGTQLPNEPTCGFAMHEFMQITRQGPTIINVQWYCVPN